MEGGVIERARWRDVFGHAEFRALFLAGVLSVAGDQLARVALSVLVFDRTESAGLTALTYALTYIPDLLFGPLLAGFADRYPRRTVMIVTDLARAVLVAAMAVKALPLLVVILLLLGLQAFGSPFNAARAATLPAVLPGDHYVLGKAANDMVVQFSQVLGFGTGGVIVVAVGTSGGLLLDSATFLLSAVLIAVGVRRRPVPPRQADESHGSYFKDLAAGFSLVTRTPKLRALVILAIGVDPSRALVLSQVVLSFGIPFALIPLVRLTSDRALMGDDTNHRVTTALGWLVAALITVLNVVLIYLTVTG